MIIFQFFFKYTIYQQIHKATYILYLMEKCVFFRLYIYTAIDDFIYREIYISCFVDKNPLTLLKQFNWFFFSLMFLSVSFFFIFQDVYSKSGRNHCVHNWWGSTTCSCEQGLAIYCGKLCANIFMCIRFLWTFYCLNGNFCTCGKICVVYWIIDFVGFNKKKKCSV